MTELRFAWQHATSLAYELCQPLAKISIEPESSRLQRPARVTLWRCNGTFLQIESQMHDVAERLEVGVLSLDLIARPQPREFIFDLTPAFQRPLTAHSLVITESGHRAHSGLRLRATDQSEVLIAANVAPFLLAIKGPMMDRFAFEPEYPLEDYEIESL